ncbi:VCBS repeat-containing protein [Polaribacter batillariae]|uniref:VCBS repeat-containing protein n=1 Tax=Polaribacter batillariae TaxID=2808900 RepID=A0ABX7SW25_9FLAO|nr:FG-GAP-like repeat-containing protein [Polaribacter batillariae]QTD38455.1 VCBS repeat-containing protein [Polaribacter batillariae]
MKNKVILLFKILFLFYAISFLSCKKKVTPNQENVKEELFTVLDFEETGLNFNNKLEETTSMNGFYYEYFYNGAGVAVADFNNDGLQDIYFTSNLRTNKLYLNQGELKFKNVSVKANAQGSKGFSTGVAIVDINNDGFKDIYILKSGRFETDEFLRNELLINTGVNENNIPIFEEKASEYNLDLPHHSTQASFFDYDRDGDLDMFLINHNINVYEIDDIKGIMKNKSEKIGEKLYRNDNGKFVNVTKKAGIISNNLGFGLGIAIGDVNNDGWPDVYTSNDYYEKDHLYINNQDGTFNEVSEKAFGHMSNFSMGNDIADINNDGYLDLISLDMMAEDNYGQKASMSGMDVARFGMIENLGLHRQYMYNTLQLNNGNFPTTKIPVFSDIAQLANISSTDWSWAPLLMDMDNDGYRDIFVSNGIKRDFRNNDFSIYLEKKYKEGSKKRNIDISKHVEDLLKKLPERKKKNYFYLNKSNLQFQKQELNQPASFSNGAAYADFDNDGDLDIVVNNIDDFAHLYRNNQKKNNYLKVKLQGTKENIDAIGTRLKVTTSENTLTAENYFTRGFQSAMAVPIHFGLGNAKKVTSLEVIWPDGKSQTLANINVNKEILISYDATHLKEQKSLENQNNDFIFKDVTSQYGTPIKHQENNYNDFSRESLLPHKMSEEGPALAVGDINSDGLDDFYIGGAKSLPGTLYVQTINGKFSVSNSNLFQKESVYEDVDAEFFDVDLDGDLDLYVVSGSNEFKENSTNYSDRIYLNTNGKFTKVTAPFKNNNTISGSVVKPYDFDSDGDLDLFIGGRQSPGKYPYPTTSFILRNDSKNGKIQFVNIEVEALKNIGMVTDAQWADIDGDKVKDLVIVGEWMPIKILKHNNGKFLDITGKVGLSNEIGWWFSVEVNDFDNDGDMDFIAGNLGLNSKYKASEKAPFEIFAKDFDQTGTLDIVLGYHQAGKLFPLRGRECSSNQMPFIKKKFPTYHEFASAELIDVYGKENISNALHYKATTFATSYFENKANGTFVKKQLPNEAQTTTITSIISEDIDKDGNLDLILLGNMYGFEVETPRQDAGYGLHLKGDGKGNFKAIMPYNNGFYVNGSVSETKFMKMLGGKKNIIIAKNNGNIQFQEIN